MNDQNNWLKTIGRAETERERQRGGKKTRTKTGQVIEREPLCLSCLLCYIEPIRVIQRHRGEEEEYNIIKNNSLKKQKYRKGKLEKYNARMFWKSWTFCWMVLIVEKLSEEECAKKKPHGIITMKLGIIVWILQYSIQTNYQIYSNFHCKKSLLQNHWSSISYQPDISHLFSKKNLLLVLSMAEPLLSFRKSEFEMSKGSGRKCVFSQWRTISEHSELLNTERKGYLSSPKIILCFFPGRE